MIILGGTVFLVIFIIVILGLLVKYGYDGSAGGCGCVISSLIVVFVVYVLVKSCEQYEHDWGDHGRYTPKTEKTNDYAADVIDSISHSATINDSAQKPTETVEEKRQTVSNKDREETSKTRRTTDTARDDYRRGYHDGYNDGESDGANGSEYGLSHGRHGTRDYQRGYAYGYENGYNDATN